MNPVEAQVNHTCNGPVPSSCRDGQLLQLRTHANAWMSEIAEENKAFV
jgi:hypothetical protein